MKKLLSIIISVIAVVSLCASFAVPAMAAVNVYSPEGEVITHSINDPTINGKDSTNVNAAQSSNDSNIIVFTYSGSGKLIGWNLIDKNGKAISLSNDSSIYKIVSQDGKTLTLQILDWSYFESPDGYTVNALVEGTSTQGGSVDKDDSSKAPETGAVSIALACAAATGAGVSILALSKKKDAE